MFFSFVHTHNKYTLYKILTQIDNKHLGILTLSVFYGAHKGNQKYFENIYKIYDSLPSEKIWSGKAYNSFKAKADSYKDDLENMVNILNSYVSVIKELNTQSTTLHGDISSVCSVNEE